VGKDAARHVATDATSRPAWTSIARQAAFCYATKVARAGTRQMTKHGQLTHPSSPQRTIRHAMRSALTAASLASRLQNVPSSSVRLSPVTMSARVRRLAVARRQHCMLTDEGSTSFIGTRAAAGFDNRRADAPVSTLD
jgi:hypothetical protein